MDYQQRVRIIGGSKKPQQPSASSLSVAAGNRPYQHRTPVASASEFLVHKRNLDEEEDDDEDDVYALDDDEHEVNREELRRQFMKKNKKNGSQTKNIVVGPNVNLGAKKRKLDAGAGQGTNSMTTKMGPGGNANVIATKTKVAKLEHQKPLPPKQQQQPKQSASSTVLQGGNSTKGGQSGGGGGAGIIPRIPVLKSSTSSASSSDINYGNKNTNSNSSSSSFSSFAKKMLMMKSKEVQQQQVVLTKPVKLQRGDEDRNSTGSGSPGVVVILSSEQASIAASAANNNNNDAPQLHLTGNGVGGGSQMSVKTYGNNKQPQKLPLLASQRAIMNPFPNLSRMMSQDCDDGDGDNSAIATMSKQPQLQQQGRIMGKQNIIVKTAPTLTGTSASPQKQRFARVGTTTNNSSSPNKRNQLQQKPPPPPQQGIKHVMGTKSGPVVVRKLGGSTAITLMKKATPGAAVALTKPLSSPQAQNKNTKMSTIVASSSTSSSNNVSSKKPGGTGSRSPASKGVKKGGRPPTNQANTNTNMKSKQKQPAKQLQPQQSSSGGRASVPATSASKPTYKYTYDYDCPDLTRLATYMNKKGVRVWICLICNKTEDEISSEPMIACETCDDWYHFKCVGVMDTPPDDQPWFCIRCIFKSERENEQKQNNAASHKKKVK